MSVVNQPARGTLSPGDATILPRLMAFEMEVRGHHPGYVKNFASAWVDHSVQGLLDFVVTPRFFELHRDVVNFVRGLESEGVRIHSLSDAEFAKMERISYFRYFKAWTYFCEYAKRLKADRGLLMYYDFFQLPSLLGRTSPIRYSAMYFRPTFHYSTFSKQRAHFKDVLRSSRKRLLLARVLKDPQLEGLYCLDEIATDYISRNFRTKTKVRRIADSFSVYPTSIDRQTEFRSELGVEPGRRIYCLLGVLDRRKGLRELLECLHHVPEECARRICIILLGQISKDQLPEVMSLLDRLQHASHIQIVLRDRYILDHEVQHYYDLSDVILATYQGHMGSSSALIRAALAGKPVLSSDYGLMGEIVKRRRLGMTVDTTDPVEMARGLAAFAGRELPVGLDAREAARYARENSPEQLARELAGMIA